MTTMSHFFFPSSFLLLHALLVVLTTIVGVPSAAALKLQIANNAADEQQQRQMNDDGIGGISNKNAAAGHQHGSSNVLLSELLDLNRHHQLTPAAAQLLLDRNAFRMSFGKRAAPSSGGIGPLLMNRLRQGQRQKGVTTDLMDGNTFRMSFGKRRQSDGSTENDDDDNDGEYTDEQKQHQQHGLDDAAEMLAHANIAIPLLFDLDSGTVVQMPSEIAIVDSANAREQQQQQPITLLTIDDGDEPMVEYRDQNSAGGILNLEREMPFQKISSNKTKKKDRQKQTMTGDHHQPHNWRTKKRLDRNLYNLGFGKK